MFFSLQSLRSAPRVASSLRLRPSTILFSTATGILFSLICLLGTSPQSRGAGSELATRAVRKMATSFPNLEPTTDPSKPVFTIYRLNVTPVSVGSLRFSAVRFHTPANVGNLIWLFSDVTNLVEYEVVAMKYDLNGGDFYSHFTYRGVNRNEARDEGIELPPTPLPLPWDQMNLQLVGLPARWLHPDEDYLIWFRFSDSQPADVLMALTFVPAETPLNGSSMAAAFGLPDRPTQ